MYSSFLCFLPPEDDFTKQYTMLDTANNMNKPAPMSPEMESSLIFA